MINDALATLLWKDDDPIGKTIEVTFGNRAAQYTVIGVTANARDRFSASAEPEIYASLFHLDPVSRVRNYETSIVVRTGVDPRVMMNAIRKQIWTVDPNQPIASINTMDDLIGRATAYTEFQTLLYTMMGILAAILACIGVYGVVAFAVTQRTREIGIRIALGSNSHRVLGLMRRQGLLPVVLGIGVGVGCSVGFTNLTRRMLTLHEIQPNDPITYAAAIGLLLFVGLIASYIPARRATQVDPYIATGVIRYYSDTLKRVPPASRSFLPDTTFASSGAERDARDSWDHRSSWDRFSDPDAAHANSDDEVNVMDFQRVEGARSVRKTSR